MSKDPDYLFALTIRAALIQIVRAIEKRYNIKTHVFDVQTIQIGPNDTVSGLPQNPE